ncbi:MAG TPA: hypothetical protein PL045_08250 [Chitinophagaceae bacterium]|nr:hypothetical protein [Chitinophagaceae bacterium]
MDIMQQMREWLNGAMPYMQGVMLYQVYGDDEKLKALFKKGPTDFTRPKLRECLLEIYNSYSSTSSPAEEKNTEEKNIVAVPQLPDVDPLVMQACEAAAKRSWKMMMAKRAELFALVRHVPAHEDVNAPDRVKERTGLCYEVHEMARKADEAYDKLAYLREIGRLPADEINVAEEFSFVTDYELKHTIDNLRKAISKLKKKEQTAERVALLQKHNSSLEKLLKRWHSLKQKI